MKYRIESSFRKKEILVPAVQIIFFKLAHPVAFISVFGIQGTKAETNPLLPVHYAVVNLHVHSSMVTNRFENRLLKNFFTMIMLYRDKVKYFFTTIYCMPVLQR